MKQTTFSIKEREQMIRSVTSFLKTLYRAMGYEIEIVKTPIDTKQAIA